MIPGATPLKRGACIAAAALVAALLAAAPASAAVFTQDENVTIADNTTATPFPSELVVSGQTGPMTDVDVSMDWTHTRPNDMDVLLVAPSGTAVVLMSDACGAAGFEGGISFDQSAEALVPTGPCGGGPYRPEDRDPGESWIFPDSGTLDAFNGENPNGRWFLYVIDDAAGSTGSIDFWSLDIEIGSSTFQIPGGPSPDELEVIAEDQTVITDLDVLLDGMSHSRPRDVDMFLEGPLGQKVWLMSDVCDGGYWSSLDIDVDDEAPNAFPESVVEAPFCDLATARPTAFDIESDGGLGASPPGLGATSLSAFDFTDPNGIWKLWVADDSAGDGSEGYLQDGWDLQMSTRPAADVGFAVSAQIAPEGSTLVVDVLRGGASPLGRGSVVVATTSGTAQAGSDFVPVSATLTFEPGQTTSSIAVPVIADGGFEPQQDFSIALGATEGDAKVGTPAAVGVTIPADQQQPASDLPPGNEDKPAPRPFSSSNVLRSAPRRRRCFRPGARIQFRPKMPDGVAIVRSEVFVNGRKVEDNVEESAIAAINLTMAGRRMRVRIRLTSHDGRAVTVRRTFRRCRRARR